jgi:hypothetical protein
VRSCLLLLQWWTGEFDVEIVIDMCCKCCREVEQAGACFKGPMCQSKNLLLQEIGRSAAPGAGVHCWMPVLSLPNAAAVQHE